MLANGSGTYEVGITVITKSDRIIASINSRLFTNGWKLLPHLIP
jgi:hypothetical protein